MSSERTTSGRAGINQHRNVRHHLYGGIYRRNSGKFDAERIGLGAAIVTLHSANTSSTLLFTYFNGPGPVVPCRQPNAERGKSSIRSEFFENALSRRNCKFVYSYVYSLAFFLYKRIIRTIDIFVE